MKDYRNYILQSVKAHRAAGTQGSFRELLTLIYAEVIEAHDTAAQYKKLQQRAAAKAINTGDLKTHAAIEADIKATVKGMKLLNEVKKELNCYDLF